MSRRRLNADFAQKFGDVFSGKLVEKAAVLSNI